MIYQNAPIREAVFDIRIDKLNITGVEELLLIRELIFKDFPVEKKRHNITGMFQFSPDKPLESKSHSDLTGYIFLSEDNTRQLQVRIDGFTLNVLKPYENWEMHFETFINYWSEYNRLFKPEKVIRIATRFINRIEIPIPFNDFQDFVINMPPIPVCLPQTFSNFFMQIQVPSKDKFRNVVITETIEPIENLTLPFILDIDVFQELNIENSKENLSLNFSVIRNIKNEIFENCITEKTRQLFK
ncbi:MAG: TIGR04255 family protein [Chitinophagaceae bacterium]